MKGIALIRHAVVVALVIAGAVFLVMGATSFLDLTVFGVLFSLLGMGLVYLAVRLNRLGDEFASEVQRIYQWKKTELAVAMALGIVANLASETIIGWLFLWPLWGTQSIVYMASIFAERILLLPFGVGYILRGLALCFEFVYLYFISSNLVVAIRAVFSSRDKPQ